MVRVRILIPSLLLLGLSALLSGCWDAEEIEQRSLVTGFALDLTGEDELLLTAQLPIPGEMLPAGIRGDEEKSFYTVSAAASSTLEALGRIRVKIPGTLETIQTQVILIGEKVAEKGIIPYLDTFSRMPKLPSNAYLILTREEAGRLLEQKTSPQRLPVFYLSNFFDVLTSQGAIYPMTLWRFLQRLDSPAADPYLPVITYDSAEEVFLLAGLAALSHDRLGALLNLEETKIFALLSGGTADFLSFPWREDKRVTFRYVRNRIKYRWERPDTIRIMVNSECYLMEETGVTIPLTPALLAEMEIKFAEDLENRARDVIRRLQKANSDPLGLGRVVRANHAGKWSAEDWRRLYPRLQIKVEFDLNINRTGLLN